MEIVLTVVFLGIIVGLIITHLPLGWQASIVFILVLTSLLFCLPVMRQNPAKRTENRTVKIF